MNRAIMLLFIAFLLMFQISRAQTGISDIQDPTGITGDTINAGGGNCAWDGIGNYGINNSGCGNIGAYNTGSNNGDYLNGGSIINNIGYDNHGNNDVTGSLYNNAGGGNTSDNTTSGDLYNNAGAGNYDQTRYNCDWDYGDYCYQETSSNGGNFIGVENHPLVPSGLVDPNKVNAGNCGNYGYDNSGCSHSETYLPGGVQLQNINNVGYGNTGDNNWGDINNVGVGDKGSNNDGAVFNNAGYDEAGDANCSEYYNYNDQRYECRRYETVNNVGAFGSGANGGVCGNFGVYICVGQVGPDYPAGSYNGSPNLNNPADQSSLFGGSGCGLDCNDPNNSQTGNLVQAPGSVYTAGPVIGSQAVCTDPNAGFAGSKCPSGEGSVDGFALNTGYCGNYGLGQDGCGANGALNNVGAFQHGSNVNGGYMNNAGALNSGDNDTQGSIANHVGALSSGDNGSATTHYYEYPSQDCYWYYNTDNPWLPAGPIYECDPTTETGSYTTYTQGGYFNTIGVGQQCDNETPGSSWCQAGIGGIYEAPCSYNIGTGDFSQCTDYAFGNIDSIYGSAVQTINGAYGLACGNASAGDCLDGNVPLLANYTPANDQALLNNALGFAEGIVGSNLGFAQGAADLALAAVSQLFFTANMLASGLINSATPLAENAVLAETSILINDDLPGFWDILQTYYAGAITNANQLLAWGVPAWTGVTSLPGAVGNPPSYPGPVQQAGQQAQSTAAGLLQ